MPHTDQRVNAAALKLQEQPAEYRVDRRGDDIINRTDWRAIITEHYNGRLVPLPTVSTWKTHLRTIDDLFRRRCGVPELCHYSRIQKYSIRVHVFSISLRIFQ